jgi:phosphocarrier protein HPr
MQEKNVLIQNKLGMHLRAAAVFIEAANRFSCQVYVRKDERSVNAKSIMGLMTLGATYGSEIAIQTDGDDETEALQSLLAVVNDRFGEQD